MFSSSREEQQLATFAFFCPNALPELHPSDKIQIKDPDDPEEQIRKLDYSGANGHLLVEQGDLSCFAERCTSDSSSGLEVESFHPR